jgi:hypothetical protein
LYFLQYLNSFTILLSNFFTSKNLSMWQLSQFSRRIILVIWLNAFIILSPKFIFVGHSDQSFKSLI